MSEWIPIEEELPNNFVEVLLHVKVEWGVRKKTKLVDVITTGYLMHKKPTVWWYIHDEELKNSTVIHWAELPRVPNKKSNKNILVD